MGRKVEKSKKKSVYIHINMTTISHFTTLMNYVSEDIYRGNMLMRID